MHSSTSASWRKRNMPRDNICITCGGAYHDDEMEGSECIYCKQGLDSGLNDLDEDEEDEG